MAINIDTAALREQAELKEQKRQEERAEFWNRQVARADKVKSFMKTAPGRFWDWQKKAGAEFRIGSEVGTKVVIEASSQAYEQSRETLRRGAENVADKTFETGLKTLLAGREVVRKGKEQYLAVEQNVNEKKQNATSWLSGAIENAQNRANSAKESVVNEYHNAVNKVKRLPRETQNLATHTWKNMQISGLDFMADVLTQNYQRLQAHSETARNRAESLRGNANDINKAAEEVAQNFEI